MSKNTTLNPGVGGDIVATDDIAGIKYQRMKVNFGVDGVAVDVSAVDPMPVVLASSQTGPYRGASSYLSGVSGTASIAAGARIVSLSATSTAGGTIQILGGASVVLPPGTAFSEGYSGFVGPGNIVFTGTDSYYVAVNL